MTGIVWTLAAVAAYAVIGIVLLSCVAALALLIGGLREFHRAGRERLRRDADREAWQRIVAANRDIDMDAP